MIYVDELREYPMGMIADEAKKFGRNWCHMMTNGRINELHEMARKIGLKREWFQDGRYPHYDLVPSKRATAIRLGAKEVSGRKMLKICGGFR